MAKLIYFTPTSLNGFIADETGDLGWATPSKEVFAFILQVLRPQQTYLYGRRNYDIMSVWQTPERIPGLTPDREEFARVWQAASKIVYSRSRDSVSTPNTRLLREFDPQAVRQWKTELSADIGISGPTLAAQAIRAGVVDEIQLLVFPALLGGGIRVLPADFSLKLDLLEQRRFTDGAVYLRYGTRA